MPIENSDYQRHSLDGLLTAVEYAEPTAREALKRFMWRKSAGRNTVIERHPQQGWRVRSPEDES